MFKNITPLFLKHLRRRTIDLLTWDPWVSRTWSQEGEDQVLQRLFESKPNGFYVDIGAHHPKRFSNTYLFYKRGWKGLNVDAMPGSMDAFNRYRPRDINVEIGVGLTASELDYYIFNEPALNGFSKELSDMRNDPNLGYEVNKIVKVQVLPLSTILDQYLPLGQEIDFMTIDVEGLDFEVLSSNNWTKHRPTFVLAEVLRSNIDEIHNSNIGRLMREAGYDLYAKCVNTIFFKVK
jgi:hypothetical protein